MHMPSSLSSLEIFLHGKIMHGVIIALVLLNGVLLGLLTDHDISASHGALLQTIDNVIIGMFVLELLIRFAATKERFFKRGWNIFDTIIIATSVGALWLNFQSLEIIRVMLLFRIIEFSPDMRRVIDAIKRAALGIINTGLLLGIIFYIFSVSATYLYGKTAPDTFGSIGTSLFTLFRLMTFDNLGDIMNPIMKVYPYSGLFFLVFLALTAFSVLNLLIGVVVQAMQDATDAVEKKEEKKKGSE
ncbi:MAG: ion transporter [Alphaproteobacteria bacterium]|jgi:voltage-gated sodium channel